MMAKALRALFWTARDTGSSVIGPNHAVVQEWAEKRSDSLWYMVTFACGEDASVLEVARGQPFGNCIECQDAIRASRVAT